MSLMKMIEDAGVSLESFVEPVVEAVPVDPALMVQETIVSPVDAPSAAIPVSDVVVSTEPVVDVMPVTEVDAVVAEAVAATQVEAETKVLENMQEIIQEKADELLEIQTALESMESMVRSQGAKGISNTTAKAIQSHLKTINRQLGIKTDFVSIESFTAKGIREEHDQATIALESIRTTAKVAKNKFIAFVEKIIAYFKKIVMNQFDGINTLEKNAVKLSDGLARVKIAGGNGTMQVANPDRLYLDGKVVQEITPDIKGLAHFSAVAYPEAIIKFFDGMVKGVLKFDPEGTGMDELEAFFEQYSKPLKFLIDQKADQDVLPGGWSLDVPEHSMSIGMRRSEAASDIGGEIPVLRTVELRRIVADVINVLAQMKKIRPEVDKISKTGDKLIAAVKRATEKKGDEANEKAYAEMADRVAKIVVEASPRISEIIGYLTRFLGMQLAIAKAQMEIITSGNTDEGGASGKSDSLGPGFENLRKFINEGKLSEIRTALRLEFNNKKNTYEGIMSAVRVTKKEVPELFVPYEEKSFARELNMNESDWTEDYFDLQITYLKTNFSEKRFKHCAQVAQHVGIIQ